MTASLVAILVASLVGSVHCVAMCGPLAALHLPADGRGAWRLAIIHSLGRLLTYATLGALAGAAGRALDLAGNLAAVQRVAATIAGVAIIVWGIVAIVRVLRARRVSHAPAGSAFEAGLVRLKLRKPATRAAALGVLTGLLPCGWLWAFVVVAAGTAHPATGALVMATFWLGTVPAMVGLSTLAAPIVRRLRARLPIITAVTLVVLGVATLAGRWNVAGTNGITRPTCHQASTGPGL